MEESGSYSFGLHTREDSNAPTSVAAESIIRFRYPGIRHYTNWKTPRCGLRFPYSHSILFDSPDCKDAVGAIRMAFARAGRTNGAISQTRQRTCT